MLVNLNPLKKNVLLPRFMLEDLKEALTKKLRETLQQEPLLRWALVKQHEPLRSVQVQSMFLTLYSSWL